MQRCSTSLVIGKRQPKPHWETLSRHETGRNQTEIRASVGKNVEKLEASHTASENAKWGTHCGNKFGGSSKSSPLSHHLTQEFHSEVCNPREMKTHGHQENSHTNIHSSHIHNIQKVETTWTAINSWANKFWHIDTVEQYSAIKKRMMCLFMLHTTQVNSKTVWKARTQEVTYYDSFCRKCSEKANV